MIVLRHVSRLNKVELVIFMMYWLGVYSLVIVGGLTPFVLLYVVSLALRLAFGTVRSAVQALKHTSDVRETSLMGTSGLGGD